MPAEEVHCNGTTKPLGSSREGIITYKRKRTRSSTPIDPQEDASGSAAASEVSNKPLPKNGRDIGLENGVPVKGSKYWQCNWCGIIRSGGVSRLKQHFVGGPELPKCLEVPKVVAKNMRKHLSPAVLKALDTINSQSPFVDDFVDSDLNCVDLDMNESNATQPFRKGTKHYEAANEQSTATQRSKMSMSKVMKESLDLVLNTRSNEQDRLDRIDSHWRNVLEHMLQLPDVSEGGGIHGCIRNALISGPSGFTEKVKVVDIPDDATEQKDRYEDHCKVQAQSQRPGSSADATSEVSKAGACGQADMNDNTRKCQNVFLNLLCSEKFALLCDLICRSFKDRKAKEILDFSLIISKMKNGVYQESPGLFDQDIRQVWEKFQTIGQEMVLLASSLSNISLPSYPKLVGEGLVPAVGEEKFEEETCQAGVEQRNSMDSNTTTQLPSYESDRSTKPDQTEASCLYKAHPCKQCGAESDLSRSLICDGCEAMYHISCIHPAVQEVPTRSWYCAACVTSRKESPEPSTKRKTSAEPVLTDVQQGGLHQNCSVCDRLEVSETHEHPSEIGGRTATADDSRENSVSSMESDEPPEPSRTVASRLCKQCGACEDEDRRFLVCGNTHCPYKFYHIRCLTNSQIASLKQRDRPCWYCPSCLCRGCLSDKDDDKIVLCDACDEGYHIYCMKPPRVCVPEGQWFCAPCNVARARDGMRKYEQWILEQHGKKDARPANEVSRSVDMLLCAAEKLRSEE